MNRISKCLYLLSALAMLALVQNAFAGAESSPSAATKRKAIELHGKVAETVDGGGYTYVLLKNGDEKMWVAIPLTKLTVGQDLTLLPGFEMKNFTSKGLNRKFDRVIFSAGIADKELKLSPSAMKMAHQGVPPNAAATAATAPAKQENPAAAKPAPAKPAPVSIEQVTKAKGPNAYTVAQIYAKKKKLEKKPVVVSGRVVQVATRIMKKNWIHIQDGTGSASKKNNNLVVTSTDLPKVGDLVTVSGTLYNNMDFGYGYRYPVLVQGARIK